jgi:DNA-binding NtrC family response regulator
MSTSVAVVESISKRRLRGLPSRLRKAHPSQRLGKIREMAGALLAEAESLDRENALAEAATVTNSLDIKSGINFFDEVKRFEVQLITLALQYAGGNQARAARLLGLGTTTLNYKIKAYELR